MWIPSRHRQTCVALATGCLFATVGCGDDRPVAVAPAPPPADFFPLTVGNEWRYSRTRTIQTILNGDPLPTTILHLIEERELAAVDTILGHEYLVEVIRSFDTAGTDTLLTTRFLRQDETGLYATRSDTLPEESTLLRYPLELGAQWLRSTQGIPVTLVVEAVDTLDLGPGTTSAYRIRSEVPSQGPEDFSRIWYGHCGRLGSALHREITAVDPLTGDIALIIVDDIAELTDLHLAHQGQCTVAP